MKNILLIGAVLAVILFIRLFIFYTSLEKYSPGTIISFETRLINEPKITMNGQSFNVFMPNNERLYVKSGLNPVLSYQDRVRITGKLDHFEAKKGSKVAMMEYPQIVLIEKGIETSFVNRIREHLIDFFDSNLSQSSAVLMLGITFGIKQEMPPAFEANLEVSGLMHVIAASGMNITLVGGFVMAIFVLFLNRRLALILTILVIVFYTALAGFEPSIVRAAIMGIIVFAAQILGRQSTAAVGLFSAAFVMLLVNPALLYDIGFQLSFLATAGLVYLRPVFIINEKIKGIVEKSIIGEDVLTTITAQIATLPVLLANFGNYSFASILINALLLWTVPIIMIIGGISAIISFIFEPVAVLVLYLSIPFLLYFTKVVDFFGINQPQIYIETFPTLIFCGYYLIIISIVIHFNKK